MKRSSVHGWAFLLLLSFLAAERMDTYGMGLVEAEINTLGREQFFGEAASLGGGWPNLRMNYERTSCKAAT